MPGYSNSRDPFGFNAFPPEPPGEWEPDPGRVPQPGAVKDYRFNRDPDAEARAAAHKRQLRLQQVSGSTKTGTNSAPTYHAHSQSAIELGKSWPAPETRPSGPPRERTAVAALKVDEQQGMESPACLDSTPNEVKQPGSAHLCLGDGTSSPNYHASAVEVEGTHTVSNNISSLHSTKVPTIQPTGQEQKVIEVSSRAYVPPHLRPSLSAQQQSTGGFAASSTQGSSLRLPSRIVSSRPNPGVPFSVPKNDTPASPINSSDDAWASIGRRTSDSETLVNGAGLGDGLDDAAIAKRMALEDHGMQNEEESLQLQKQLLDQFHKEKPKPAGYSIRAAYIRLCETREILLKQEDVTIDPDLYADEEALNAMKPDEFNGHLNHIRQLHRFRWEARNSARFSKAKEIESMQAEMSIIDKKRYTVAEILTMDEETFNHQYQKVSSHYEQHLAAERGGSRLAAFHVEELKKYGGRKPSEDLIKTMEANLGSGDFETDSSSGGSSFENDKVAYSDDDNDEDDDDLCLFRGRGPT